MAIAPVCQRAATATGLVVALTAGGFALGLIDPGLAGRVAPHPALTGSLSDAIGILDDNVRALALPFVLAVLRLSESRLGRWIGDLAALALVAVNAIPVGVALGRWQARLVPYVPQLPLEWAALSVAVTAWLHFRTDHPTLRCLAGLAALTLTLLTVAASLETWCTPHRYSHTTIKAGVRGGRAHQSVPAQTSRRADFATDDAPAAAGSLQGRTLPSPRRRSVPLSRMPALTGLTSTHRPPGGIK